MPAPPCYGNDPCPPYIIIRGLDDSIFVCQHSYKPLTAQHIDYRENQGHTSSPTEETALRLSVTLGHIGGKGSKKNRQMNDEK